MKHMFFTRAAAGLALSLAFCQLAGAQTLPFSQAPFTDVPKTSPYYEAVEYMRQNNIVRGYLDGTFKLNNRINRAEMAQLITNPMFIDSAGMNDCVQRNTSSGSTFVSFNDVDASIWYATPICIAKERMLVNGYPDGRFRPGDPINFAEAAKIIVNTFVSDFKSDPNDQQWYVSYVKRLSDLKAIPTSIKRADQIVTRGEVVEMIFRVKLNNTMKTSTNWEDVR